MTLAMLQPQRRKQISLSLLGIELNAAQLLRPLDVLYVTTLSH
jgi:hypothetical protein